MGRNRLGLSFEGLDLYARRLEKLGGDIKNVAEKCLVKSKEHITPKLHQVMSRHHLTGATEASIDENTSVEWSGTQGKLPVGFNLGSGGLPSVFLMYGTPRMKKDQAMYNAIYGSGIKKEVTQIQQEIFNDEILKQMGG